MKRKIQPLSLKHDRQYPVMLEFYEDKLADLMEEIHRVNTYIKQITIHNRDVANNVKETL